MNRTLAFQRLLGAVAALAEAPPTEIAAVKTAEAAPADVNCAIIVTGSRVAHGFQATTTLAVLTREEIEASARSNNISDFAAVFAPAGNSGGYAAATIRRPTAATTSRTSKPSCSSSLVSSSTAVPAPLGIRLQDM